MPSSKAIAQIKSDEGIRKKAYFDKLDIKTIGRGFNLERPDAKEQLILAGVSADDIDEVMSGKKVLNANQIDALFNNTLLEAEAVADGFIGGSEVPQVVKDAVVNMSFQLGPERLSGFELMKAALDKSDWKGVREEMADSKWAKIQTPKRAKRLINSLSGLKQPAPTVPEKPIDPKTAMKEEQRARDIEIMATSLARSNQIESMAQALADSQAAEQETKQTNTVEK